MTRARDIMQPTVECIGSTDSAADAARRMSELHVGALPICGEDGRLKGMITDRDIVIEVVARGHDPERVRAGELAQGEAVTIGADDDTSELLATMAEHQVRRVPVIDGHSLVGIIAQADIARALPDQRVGDLVAAVSFD
ncbi:signal transduction protein [Tsukamurella pulmonis]|uniref:CBS domain-containing protein n=1 Tax=Tsukamurella pulmonis TaxID=47312 RepID=UPI001EDDF957|nr:CBS domain-containing protein [Tsukamurella pulmonis]BDD81761.1 signal transduction protein [Tsukamurella pulmonis]